MKEIHLSVRDLVEFILRQGNIDATYVGSKRMQEGVVVHNKLQKKREKECRLAGNTYLKEVPLSHCFSYKGFLFHLNGRADGIISGENMAAVEEIKSTTKALDLLTVDPDHWHFAQAKCYGFMYAQQNNLEQISVILTYATVEKLEEKSFKQEYTLGELGVFLESLAEKYLVFAQMDYDRIKERNETVTRLSFPYETYRPKQRPLMATIYQAIQEQQNIFAQAPTGTGKTISTLFPSIKALGQGLGDKIFYLTAKTITRQTAEEALGQMKERGLRMRSITLIAKDKICFQEETVCLPEKCSYAKGHFDRVNQAILDIVAQETLILRETLEKYARKHQVCPFELGLDVSLFTDCIICDYNYAYDPKAQLKRYFGETTGAAYLLLHDEAHNLPDRARDMFSAAVSLQQIQDMKKLFRQMKVSALHKILVKAEKQIQDYSFDISPDFPQELGYIFQNFISRTDGWLVENQGTKYFQQVLDFYFTLMDFTSIGELFDASFVCFIDRNTKPVIKLLCLDPSHLLRATQKMTRANIFFSATLTPIGYFKHLLGGLESDGAYCLPSPYPAQNLCLLVHNKISTKYKDRENSFKAVALSILAMTGARTGNYMVFFPSYLYLEKVFTEYKALCPPEHLLCQAKDMVEEEREAFLAHFRSREKPVTAFTVLGGIFSEGIDLPGECLIGAAIVGVGLPMVTTQRNIMADYFTKTKGNGFDYAYVYPGMNKVLQAAGRVIRSEKDKGVILLIDSRFTESRYRALMPPEWAHFQKVSGPEDITGKLASFWEHRI